MWTHLTPYLRPGLTATFIAKDARVNMYRALNLRRLVALTGSGATNSFGFPGWNDLALLFFEVTMEQVSKAISQRTPLPMNAGERSMRDERMLAEIDPVIEQIVKLCNLKRPDDLRKVKLSGKDLKDLSNTTIIMDLCEEILRRLPDDFETGRSRLHQARDAFAQNFRNSDLAMARSRLEHLATESDVMPERPDRQTLDADSKRGMSDDHVELLKMRETVGLFPGILSQLATTSNPVQRARELLRKLHDLEYRRDRVLGEDEERQFEKWRHKEHEPGHPPNKRQIEAELRRSKFGPYIPDDDQGRDIVATLARKLRISRIATLNYDVQVEREILRRMTAPVDDDSDVFVDLCKDYKTPRDYVPKTVVESGLRKGAMSISLGPQNIGDIVNFSAFSRRYEWQVLHLHGRFDDPENMVVTKPDYLRVYMREGLSREVFREAQDTLFGGNDVLMVGIGMKEEDVLRPFRRFVAQDNSESGPARRVFLLREVTSCKNCEPDKTCGSCARKDAELALRYYVDYRVHTIQFGGPIYRYVASRLNIALKKLGKKEGEPEWEEVTTALERLAEPRAPELLSRGERELLRELPTKIGEGLFSQDAAAAPLRRAALVKLLEEFRGRVISRGLCHELEALKDESQIWWDAWRQPPFERRALYRMADEQIAGARHYLWIRHCPALEFATPPGTFNPSKYALLREARQEAEAVMQAHDLAKLWHDGLEAWVDQSIEEGVGAGNPAVIGAPEDQERIRFLRPNRRILRLSIPRGGGKGSFIRLLTRQEVQNYLFAEAQSPNGSANLAQIHKAAFVAHLSFSIEFSSVAIALTRFFARQAVKLIVESLHQTIGDRPLTEENYEVLVEPFELTDHQASVLLGLRQTEREVKARIEHALEEKRNERPWKRYFIDLETAFASEEADRAKVIIDAVRYINAVSDSQRAELARLLYISRREDSPELLADPYVDRVDERSPQPEREHRLELLSAAMQSYEDATRAAGGDQHRLFICLSGIDRICDRDGDGRNPMHRALFRLLTGTTGGDTREPDPPIDLVLIGGKPDVPIAFLSEELDPGVTVAPEDEKKYSRTSKTGRVLKKWKRLEPFGWQDRKRLFDIADFQPGRQPEFVGKALRDANQVFFDWAQKYGGALRRDFVQERLSTRAIHRFFWLNMSMSAMALAAWRERAVFYKSSRPGATREELKREFRQFIEALDAAVTRDGAPGVLGQIQGTYRSIDKTRDQKVEDLSQSAEMPVGLDRDLVDLILRHLVLFSLPVEAPVLADCPEVRRRLVQLYEASSGRGSRVEKPEDAAEQCRLGEQHRVDEQRWMRRALVCVLERLCQRSLVIGIRSASSMDDTQTQGGANLQRRYALHARLREYLAHQMNLQVSDDGDLNHHQISVYCDQPMDLPTPGPRHFMLVKELVDTFIDKCRDTLEATYRHTLAGIAYERQLWDPPPDHRQAGEDRERDLISERAARHIYSPVPDTDGFIEVHAVAQRLRACFSLVRGLFSVGSLSRLDGVALADGDPPFEVYRGWIRGMLNAATGLERNRSELGQLLSGALFAESPEGSGLTLGSDPDELKKMIAGLNMNEAGQVTVGKDSGPLVAALHRHQLSLSDQPREFRKSIAEPKARLHKRTEHLARLTLRLDKLAENADRLGLKHLQSTKNRRLRHPYYRDEIAWLYNERALSSLIQGRIFDAIPLFNQALFIMRHKPAPDFDRRAFHAAERRINLNLAIACIERGRVADSRRLLDELARSLEHVQGSTPSRVHVFANAYIALCDHLGGSFERAALGYQRALDAFIEARDLRAISIFNRHYGDMLLKSGDIPGARDKLKLAENAAAQAEQRDVQNLALVSQAHLLMRTGEESIAQGYIARAGAYAERMGLYRLSADVLLADAHLKYRRGEYASAGEAAAKTIALSTRNGLRLRKLSALVTYGDVQVSRDQIPLAISILAEAKREAEKFGYQIQASKASELLAKLEL